MIPERVLAELAAIGEDRRSGATELVLRGIALLKAASSDAELLRRIASELCRRQPSMAGFRTAAALAVSTHHPSAVLDALQQQVSRAPAAIARLAVPLLRLRQQSGEPLRIVTCSRSSAVEQTLQALRAHQRVQVCCSESRPAREGIGLATALASGGLDIQVYSDAGISAAIPTAAALIVGADAVARSSFINKVGTAAMAALARYSGVPVFVLAGAEKLLPVAVYRSLPLVERDPDELDTALPEHVRNPYFERIPAELATQLVTDRGAFPFGEAERSGWWTAAVVAGYESILLI